jgi:hypothetical protein
MARTLSDTIIVSIIEAATRLSGARGPITGSAAAQSAAHSEAGGPVGQDTGATTDAAPKAEKATGAPSGSGRGASGGSDEHDTRSAGQIGNDFQTIYKSIEEVVKASAEQETKAVGFAPR